MSKWSIQKGQTGGFNSDILDYQEDAVLDDDVTLGKLYSVLKMGALRFYLCTNIKEATNAAHTEPEKEHMQPEQGHKEAKQENKKTEQKPKEPKQKLKDVEQEHKKQSKYIKNKNKNRRSQRKNTQDQMQTLS